MKNPQNPLWKLAHFYPASLFISDLSRRFMDNATNSYSRSRSCLQWFAQCWLWNRFNLCVDLTWNVKNCRWTISDKSIRNVQNRKIYLYIVFFPDHLGAVEWKSLNHIWAQKRFNKIMQKWDIGWLYNICYLATRSMWGWWICRIVIWFIWYDSYDSSLPKIVPQPWHPNGISPSVTNAFLED